MRHILPLASTYTNGSRSHRYSFQREGIVLAALLVLFRCDDAMASADFEFGQKYAKTFTESDKGSCTATPGDMSFFGEAQRANRQT